MNDSPDPLIARMSSLADASRLRMMHVLERQALLVNDLAEVLQLPQSTVSRHLKQLSEQGWLASHRAGTSHQYRMLVEELDDSAKSLWSIARAQTQDWPTIAQDRLRLASVLAARQRDSRSFFAGAARDWDQLRAEYFGAQFAAAGLFALLDPSLVVADLGCGTGALLEQLAPCVSRVIGVDNSDEMLSAARVRVGRRSNVELKQGDLAQLPIKANHVDAATCILSLSYVADVDASLRDIRRILKPGGRLAIVDVIAHDRDDFRRQMGQSRMGFADPDLTQSLRAAGFANAAFRPLPPEPQAKGPALFVAVAS
jgi:SAM-dependent methyltransferase